MRWTEHVARVGRYNNKERLILGTSFSWNLRVTLLLGLFGLMKTK